MKIKDEQWKDFKRFIGAIFFFLIAPAIVCWLIEQDLALWGDNQPTLGFVVFLYLWWLGVLLLWQYKSEVNKRRKQIKQLLENSMSESEKTIIKREIDKMNL